MPIATGAQSEIHIAVEAVEGTTPATPDWKEMNKTGITIDPAIQTYESKRIRSDRNKGGTWITTVGSSGDVSDELSFGGTTDDLIEACLGGTWASARTYTGSISTAALDNSLNGTGLTLYEVGELISVTGVTALTDVVVVSSTTTKIVISGATLTDITATSSVITSKADNVKVGAIDRSFSVLKVLNELEVGAGKYQLYPGSIVSKVALAMSPDSAVTSTFSFSGRTPTEPEYVSLTSTTPATTEPMRGKVTEISIDGVTFAYCSKFDLSIENPVTSTYFLGGSMDNAVGSCKVSGTMTMSYNNSTLWKKALGGTPISFKVEAVDPAGNKYIFDMENVQLLATPSQISGEGAISSAITFSSVYDAVTQTSLKIERRPV